MISSPARIDESCPDCCGFGWVVAPDGGAGTARRCSCKLQPPEGDELRYRLKIAGMAPDEIDSALRTDWRLGRYSAKLRADLEELASAEWPPERPWLLSGVPGTGKTTAAARAAANWLRRQRGPVAWCAVKTDISRAMEERRNSDFVGPTSEDIWMRSSLLVLDGIGDEQATPARLDLLERLIIWRARHSSSVGLIVITNADEWRDLVDGRLSSRLSGAREVQVVGPDWRVVHSRGTG